MSKLIQLTRSYNLISQMKIKKMTLMRKDRLNCNQRLRLTTRFQRKKMMRSWILRCKSKNRPLILNYKTYNLKTMPYKWNKKIRIFQFQKLKLKKSRIIMKKKLMSLKLSAKRLTKITTKLCLTAKSNATMVKQLMTELF